MFRCYVPACVCIGDGEPHVFAGKDGFHKIQRQDSPAILFVHTELAEPQSLEKLLAGFLVLNGGKK